MTDKKRILKLTSEIVSKTACRVASDSVFEKPVFSEMLDTKSAFLKVSTSVLADFFFLADFLAPAFFATALSGNPFTPRDFLTPRTACTGCRIAKSALQDSEKVAGGTKAWFPPDTDGYLAATANKEQRSRNAPVSI